LDDWSRSKCNSGLWTTCFSSGATGVVEVVEIVLIGTYFAVSDSNPSKLPPLAVTSVDATTLPRPIRPVYAQLSKSVRTGDFGAHPHTGAEARCNSALRPELIASTWFRYANPWKRPSRNQFTTASPGGEIEHFARSTLGGSLI